MSTESNLILKRIVQEGWTEEASSQFMKKYARSIEWSIIVNMERLGLLRFRVNPDIVHSLPSRRLELFENTRSDIKDKLLSGLIPKYLQGVEEGKIQQSFLGYLAGVIRFCLIKNARKVGLLGKETPDELIRGLCKGKKRSNGPDKHRVAWVKFCLEHQAREEILSRCPDDRFQQVYKNIHHVSDYLFEQFIPKQCSDLLLKGSNLLPRLIEMLLSTDIADAIQYRGSITPYAYRADVTSIREPEDTVEDEYLTALKDSLEGTW